GVTTNVVPASEPGPIRRGLALECGGRDFLLTTDDRDYGSRRSPGRREIYRSLCHSRITSLISALAASLIAEGVREKRGAGAGWVTPWRSTKISLAAMCGWFGASRMVRTGAKQTSVPSMILHQSSRVLLLNTSAS